MIRTAITLLALALAGTFAYFYVSDGSGRNSTDKLTDAAVQTGEVARDQAVAALVRARIVADVGLQTSRFLHVWFQDGKALIYGLAPEGVEPSRIASAARQVPGVQDVDVQVMPRPAYLSDEATNTQAEQPPG